MFELPELTNLASQLNEAVAGRTVHDGSLGNRSHKFVWYDRTHEGFTELVLDKRVGQSSVRGRWLFVPLEPGYVLLLGECGGRLLYHPPGTTPPDTFHLRLGFDDDSVLTLTTAMWGAVELHDAETVEERQYIRGMRPTPADPRFTLEYLSALIDEVAERDRRSAKGLLTQDQLIPGLGNAIAQDILHRARLHPRHPLADLGPGQRRALHDAIITTLREVTEGGGRNDEVDLYGRPGRYVRRMDRHAVGRPCPDCGTAIEKLQYLGGSCYVCPTCQT